MLVCGEPDVQLALGVVLLVDQLAGGKGVVARIGVQPEADTLLFGVNALGDDVGMIDG